MIDLPIIWIGLGIVTLVVAGMIVSGRHARKSFERGEHAQQMLLSQLDVEVERLHNDKRAELLDAKPSNTLHLRNEEFIILDTTTLTDNYHFPQHAYRLRTRDGSHRWLVISESDRGECPTELWTQCTYDGTFPDKEQQEVAIGDDVYHADRFCEYQTTTNNGEQSSWYTMLFRHRTKKNDVVFIMIDEMAWLLCDVEKIPMMEVAVRHTT